jgi:hypothetical protein
MPQQSQVDRDHRFIGGHHLGVGYPRLSVQECPPKNDQAEKAEKVPPRETVAQPLEGSAASFRVATKERPSSPGCPLGEGLLGFPAGINRMLGKPVIEPLGEGVVQVGLAQSTQVEAVILTLAVAVIDGPVALLAEGLEGMMID